jgi:uncharacterized protein YhhL (DUF1145 family)
MSAGKIGCLVLYAVLVLVAVSQAGTPMGTGAAGILLALAVSHLIEMVLYYRLCQQASGSLAANLLNVFVFGYFHMIEMKAQQRNT